MLIDKNIKMYDLVNDLVNHHHLVGVKSDFESEGSTVKEALYLKQGGLNLNPNINLDYRVKIGGAEAIKDLYDAKTIEANSIISPMIETPYALRKYINAIDSVFAKQEQESIKFYINIETITGFNNLDKIILDPLFSSRISGVVLGLVDMSRSLGLSRENIFSDKMLNIAKTISEKIKDIKKEMLIGGGTCKRSLSFFSKIPYLLKFETRKLIFDASSFLNDTEKNNVAAFIKATYFEILWLKSKKDFGGVDLISDIKRIELLESRLDSLEKDFERI